MERTFFCRIITFVTRKKKKNDGGNEAGKAAREVIHDSELEAVKLTKEMEHSGNCNGEDNAGTDDALKGSSNSVKKEYIQCPETDKEFSGKNQRGREKNKEGSE
ncbi:hypothetical protein OIU77_029090 [Salix suchowensis]|uniref:Uncharacterized protein n=1 Tax=Salix suchowensis TaxID=1278906 RepID=A0ABQ9BNI6_9ROSI|nr:hypothetical protein OIU77_029090 [Salix suchowensis]